MAAKDFKAESLPLSTEQVINIVEASARCGISALKFRDLEIKFGKQTEPGNALPGGLTKHAPTAPVAEMTDDQHKKNDKAALERSELELRAEQLEELKITNPVMFEQLVNEGELEENDDDATYDDDDITSE